MTFEEIHTRVANLLVRPDIVQRAGIAEGTNSATLRTTIDFNYWLWGKQYVKSATDNIAMTALAVQAISTYCLYLVMINTTGTISIKKGTEVATDTPSLPTVTAGLKAIGAFKIQTNGATTFTCGTTDLSAAGLTVTYYDFDCGPIRDTINEIIHNLETEFNYRHMKIRTQTSLVSGDYAITNPFTNYKELITSRIIDSNGYAYEPLLRILTSEAMTAYPNVTETKGRPLTISDLPTVETSQTPDSIPTIQFLLRPTSDDSYTLDAEAYQYSPDLDGAVYNTNWWTQNHSRILIYGTLLDLVGLMKEYPVQAVQLWERNYTEAKELLKRAQRGEQISGSQLNIGQRTKMHYNILTDTYQ